VALRVIAPPCFSGCAIGDFTSYSGQQQIGQLSQVIRFDEYVIPAYVHSCRSPVHRIGYLVEQRHRIRRRGVVAFAARELKELGADAIIVMQQGQEYAEASAAAAPTRLAFSTIEAYRDYDRNRFSAAVVSREG